MATYSMASEDTRPRPSRSASICRVTSGSGPSATGSSKAPRNTFCRKPTSKTTNFIENAPTSMPHMGWAMVSRSLLSPVLQDAGGLLGRRVQRHGILQGPHRVDDGGDLLLDLARLAGGHDPVSAGRGDVGHRVEIRRADVDLAHALQHAVAGIVAQHRRLRLREHLRE